MWSIGSKRYLRFGLVRLSELAKTTSHGNRGRAVSVAKVISHGNRGRAVSVAKVKSHGNKRGGGV